MVAEPKSGSATARPLFVFVEGGRWRQRSGAADGTGGEVGELVTGAVSPQRRQVLKAPGSAELQASSRAQGISIRAARDSLRTHLQQVVDQASR